MARYRRGLEPDEPSLSDEERSRLDMLFRQINREPYREPRGPTLRTASGHPVEPRFIREICNRDERR